MSSGSDNNKSSNKEEIKDATLSEKQTENTEANSQRKDSSENAKAETTQEMSESVEATNEKTAAEKEAEVEAVNEKTESEDKVEAVSEKNETEKEAEVEAVNEKSESEEKVEAVSEKNETEKEVEVEAVNEKSESEDKVEAASEKSETEKEAEVETVNERSEAAEKEEDNVEAVVERIESKDNIETASKKSETEAEIEKIEASLNLRPDSDEAVESIDATSTTNANTANNSGIEKPPIVLRIVSQLWIYVSAILLVTTFTMAVVNVMDFLFTIPQQVKLVPVLKQLLTPFVIPVIAALQLVLGMEIYRANNLARTLALVNCVLCAICTIGYLVISFTAQSGGSPNIGLLLTLFAGLIFWIVSALMLMDARSRKFFYAAR